VQVDCTSNFTILEQSQIMLHPVKFSVYLKDFRHVILLRHFGHFEGFSWVMLAWFSVGSMPWTCALHIFDQSYIGTMTRSRCCTNTRVKFLKI